MPDKVYFPDPFHQCPRNRKGKGYVHCDDPDHNRLRCNVKGRPLSSLMKEQIYGSLLFERELGICNICRSRRRRRNSTPMLPSSSTESPDVPSTISRMDKILQTSFSDSSRTQQKSLSTRKQHAHNRSQGAQIIDDIIYSWVLVSPRARKLRSEAEQILLRNSLNVRVRQFD